MAWGFFMLFEARSVCNFAAVLCLLKHKAERSQCLLFSRGRWLNALHSALLCTESATLRSELSHRTRLLDNVIVASYLLKELPSAYGHSAVQRGMKLRDVGGYKQVLCKERVGLQPRNVIFLLSWAVHRISCLDHSGERALCLFLRFQ